MLLGLALCFLRGPVPQASTTLLLNVGPESQPGTAILNDQTIAQSRAVADQAKQALKLQETTDSFQSTYSATVLTDRVLSIDATAATMDQAVARADAVAAAFLKLRKDNLRQLQRLQFAGLDRELATGREGVASIDDKIRQLQQNGGSQDEIQSLRTERGRASKDLQALDDQVSTAKAAAQQTTADMVGQSKVLDAASPEPAPSRTKTAILYGGAGLVAGLLVGIGITVVRALVSDRLWTRDDVAFALGAPVRLSVRTKAGWFRRRGRRGLASALKNRDIQLVTSFLNDAAAARDPRRGLAVVPVDDDDVAALSVVSLALSLARWLPTVVVADLGAGRPIARLFGVEDADVHAIAVSGAELTLVVPEEGEVAPSGPFGPASPSGSDPGASAEVSQACEGADLVVVLATLDPSTGSEYLSTWAADAVVTVTAGRSSWTRIHAASELIRLGGSRLVAAVLLGEDKWDETLGRPMLGAPAPSVARKNEDTAAPRPAHARVLTEPADVPTSSPDPGRGRGMTTNGSGPAVG
jgi:capsular polysaccharide biosynthesis protein